MLLLTKDLERRLRNAPRDNPDNQPLVKFFTPDAGMTWLFSELDGDTLYGLHDLGLGFVEFGNASLSELKMLRGSLGLPVERDRYFRATQSLQAYHDEAQANGALMV